MIYSRARYAGLMVASVPLLLACSTGSVAENDTTVAKNTAVIGSQKYATSKANYSSVFQSAIDDISLAGGGEVIVPQGQYQIHNVDLKDNVYLKIQNGVVLTPGKGRGANLFNCGNDGSPVKNVAIVGPDERFTVDFTTPSVEPEVTKLRLVGIGDCDGFRFANINIKDNYTVFSSFILGWDGHDGARPKHGRNGTVENITATNAHYGYGAIQAHSGENIIFRNIKSIGGVAVRLETGLIPMNKAQIGGLDEILVDGAYSEYGQAALMFQPHTMQHGTIIARNIEANGSEFAVSIAAPFVSKSRYTDEEGLKPGSYKSLTIDNIKATYTDGPIITRFTHLKYYPVELHSSIKRVESSPSQPDLRGPSIAAVSLQDTLTQTIEISNVKATGFNYRPDIIKKEHVYKGREKDIVGRKNGRKKKR